VDLEWLEFFVISQVWHALQQAQAAVPSQNSVVITLRADLFGSLETLHGFLKVGRQRMGQLSDA
jgi:hypothetical protein